ncbi:Nramp family divalent metal transporter [Olsenella sp. DNF00959]|uniref:Nramp family divalent metal transporter n=1 Tax=Olsenella sp. DNF00959 TaxID=1476999 RepID=UPI000AF9E3D7|nr:Nramp family divalent metal transporter [Olsenella sp. DNF00959]
MATARRAAGVDAAPSRGQRLRSTLSVMGPGILTALAGMDAGGIATFSSEGARYGFGMLWSIPLTCLLLVVVQETAARMACVTGKGFASLIREQFGIRISTVAMLAVILSNFSVTVSEFAGIASGLLLFGIPVYVSVPVAALASWLLAMSGSYRHIEKVLLTISAVFVTYVITGVVVGPDWGKALGSTVVPQMSGDPAYISLLVASIGTTISPYMIFMVSSNVAEKNLDEGDILGQRADNVSGALVSQAIAWFIVLTTASVLFPAGVVIQDAADAAQALVPLAGKYSAVLFAAGLVGASFLASCVMPGITAGAVCEAFGWERGTDRSWKEAPAYRGILTAIAILSAALVLLPGANLFGIMMAAQIVNGVLLPVLLVCMVNIASDRHVMGRWANGRIWNALTWFTIVAVVVLTVIMFALQAMGY